MSSKNTHGTSTSRHNPPNQNRERRQRQQQQPPQHNYNNNNSNNNNDNLNNSSNQHRPPNPSVDSVDPPSSPVHASNKEQRRTLATRQQQQQPHTKAPVIVQQPSIFATFSRNLRSFLPLSSTALPPVVTGADAGGTNISIGPGAGVSGRRRPLSLGVPRVASASGGSLLYDSGSGDEEQIISAQWCDVDEVDHTNHVGEGGVKSPQWLILSYASGVQIWDTSNLSSVREVLNLYSGSLHIHGRVLEAAILPAPSSLDGIADEFVTARPLICILTSSQFTVYSLPSQSVVKQIPLNDATHFHARSNFIVITTVNPSVLHILSASSLTILHEIHLPTSVHPSIALSRRLLAYTSPPPPNLHLYGPRNSHRSETFISRASQRRERGERKYVSPNSLRDALGTSMIRVGGGVWGGMKALAAASPINIGGGFGNGSGGLSVSTVASDDIHRGYSKSAPSTTMSTTSLTSDPASLSSASTGTNWITVLDLKALLHGGSPRVVSQFAPFSSDSLNHGDIAQLWFGAGNGTGAAPMLCVAPRDGQRVAVFQIRVSRKVSLATSVGPEGADNDGAKTFSDSSASGANLGTVINTDTRLEMPLHWYDLRRGLTSAKIENVVWDKAGKWVGVCTAKRTIHVFAPNPYGGETDRLTHLSTRVANAEQIQPLSTELSPVVRLRPFDNPAATSNNLSSGSLETTSHTFPLTYVFVPPSISNTLPSSLIPQSSNSSHSSSPASSFPLLSPSPQLHAALPKKPVQDVLVFNGATGEMSLYRIGLDWINASAGSVDQSVSTPVPTTGYVNASRYSFSLPVPKVNSETARKTSGVSPVTAESHEEGHLAGKETMLATWNLKRGRDWAEVKGISLFEAPSAMGAPEKKKNFPDFIAQAELSPFSLSPGILPKSIYLSHQFSFYKFNTWDYHALLNAHQLNSVIGEEIVFRRDVEISGTGDDQVNTENADEEMVFGLGDAVDLQRGAGTSSPTSTVPRRSSISQRTGGAYGTFDVPIATAIRSELDYSSQSPPTIPMFPNGIPASTGTGGRSPTIPPPLRRGAVVAGAVAAEGFGRIRREVGSMMRSPVLRPVRVGASERRKSVGGTSIKTTSSASVSPSPRALEPMPLEFDETDEVFLEDDIEDLVPNEKELDKIEDALKVGESEAVSTSGSIGVGPSPGASVTASVSTPRTQPDEVNLDGTIEWPGSQGDETWDDEARATVAEAEMFDEISVTGFMDEDMGLYEKKK